MKKKRRLTIKQKLFLKRYIELKNATKAALEVYDCTYESARAIGAQNLAKLNIHDELQYWFERKDMTDAKLVDNIKKLQDFKEWQALKEGIKLEMQLKGKGVEKDDDTTPKKIIVEIVNLTDKKK